MNDPVISGLRGRTILFADGSEFTPSHWIKVSDSYDHKIVYMSITKHYSDTAIQPSIAELPINCYRRSTVVEVNRSLTASVLSNPTRSDYGRGCKWNDANCMICPIDRGLFDLCDSDDTITYHNSVPTKG